MSNDRPKRARAGACATCRTRKRRCIPAENTAGCQLCQLLSIPCSLSHASGPRILSNGPVRPVKAIETSTHPPRNDLHAIPTPLPQGQPHQGPAALGSQDLFHELVLLYFRFIHNIAHTMFHEPTFLLELSEGKASMVHVYAMCALAARFSDNPFFHGIPPCSRGKVYASEAMRLCQETTISPSLKTVQGFILIGYYFSGEGDIQAKHIYVGLARLHAEALPLWEIPSDCSVVCREEYRRTWLSVHIASHWCASDMSMEPPYSSNGPELLPEIDDVAFHLVAPEILRENQVPTSSRCDMWAQMARTLDVFTKINVLLRQLSQGVISFDQYYLETPLLQTELDEWIAKLPPGLTYSMTNLKFFVKQKLGRTFLSMHIGYHHFRQMLFFPFLDARARAGRDTASMGQKAAQCKLSANIVSEIIQNAMDVADCDLEYFIYGHIAVVSSCVHLHALLSSDDSAELSMARQRLVSNFKYLMNLKLYWPVVDLSVARLRTFQDSCRDSISDPFVLDNWMARFLTEHSSALSERQILHPGLSPSHPDWLLPSATGTYDSVNELTGGTTGIDSPSQKFPGRAYQNEISTEWDTLSSLLNDQGMTSEALINNALNWLLE